MPTSPTDAILCVTQSLALLLFEVQLNIDPLSRREPLPPLFMRFVMQAGFAWPALTPLTVDLLCKLISKQARLAAIGTHLAGPLIALQTPRPCSQPTAFALCSVGCAHRRPARNVLCRQGNV